MTTNDREYIELTAKVTAQEAVKEFRLTLNCDTNAGRISELEQTVNNGLKDRTVENSKGLRVMRKFIFWAVTSIVILMAGGVIASIFT